MVASVVSGTPRASRGWWSSMRRTWLFLTIAVPLAAAAGDSPPVAKRIDPTLEDLAHSFFLVDPRSPEQLAGIVSQRGVAALAPATIERKKLMADPKVLLSKVRELCVELKKARTGEEFAATLTRLDEQERVERRNHAAQLLALLDREDRKALEDYLDSVYRAGNSSFSLDYHAIFATRPFPSEYSDRMLRTACEDAPAAMQGQL